MKFLVQFEGTNGWHTCTQCCADLIEATELARQCRRTWGDELNVRIVPIVL